ncbi:cysteine desulfurase family protein [Ruania rhizosphaerae]|uniref:cysteine desulfurase family protein n=1 Tax=Ruania rhizosphaerae TaxID=1840413 RepID=UPI00135B5727|nr:cysteine desulfurase family protein [Ruania rhizosphaerae]
MNLYLDAAATTPMRREALEAMWPYLTGEFGNPSSHHGVGERAAAGLSGARRSVAAVLGGRASEVTFTSGGTEGANLAIKGLALANPRGRHLVTAAIEHEAVLESVDYLRRVHGFEVSMVPVTREGVVTPDSLRAVLREDTTLVSVALANNEIGTVQDIAALSAVAHDAGALMHTDAVQAAGWLSLDVRALGVDALSLSGHKVGAGKGIGVVFLRGRLAVEPVLHGGGQERDRRSGTENVAGAVAMGVALALAESGREERVAQVGAAMAAFTADVLTQVPTARLTGPSHVRDDAGPAAAPHIPADQAAARPDAQADETTPPPHSQAEATSARVGGSAVGRVGRLPNHASFCFPGVSGEAVLLELERRGVISSSGSACAAGSDEPSHVLLACGIEPEVAQTSVRFTAGGEVSGDQLAAITHQAAPLVAEAVAAVSG